MNCLILLTSSYIFESMLLTPHTLVGITIATAIHNPVVAVPASFIFHFLGDLVPHWDFYTDTTREQRIKGWRPLAVMADLGLGIAIGVYFTLYALWLVKDSSLAANIFLCGIASVLPDVMTGPSLYLHKSPAIFEIVHKIQSKLQFPAKLPWGILSQLLVSLFCVLMILSSIR